MAGDNIPSIITQEGVGDTPDSYAYDGNRVRKWNVTTTNYGKVRAQGVFVGEGSAADAFHLCVTFVCFLSVLGGRGHCQLPHRPG